MPSGVYKRSKEHSEKHAELMRKKLTGKFGRHASAYKDGRATYGAIHEWLKFHYKKGDVCEHCGQKKEHLDWANISGQYRRDRSDFKVLCRTCHKIFDNKNMCKKRLHELTPENTDVLNPPLKSGLLRRRCKACHKAWKAQTRGSENAWRRAWYQTKKEEFRESRNQPREKEKKKEYDRQRYTKSKMAKPKGD